MADIRPPKTLYFVRHGQSEANEQRLFQGADSPLSQLGREQATFVAHRLKHVDIDVIISSPMPRALETAQEIHTATGIPLETHESLRELMPPSQFINTPHDTPEGIEYTMERLAHSEDPDFTYGDEESYNDLHVRVQGFLHELEARDETNIVVVSHAGLLRVIMTTMMTEGAPDAYIASRLMRFLMPQNTGITVFVYNPDLPDHRNKWRLLTFNDHAHLAETTDKEP